MPFAWSVSSAIEFTSNGVKVMGDLSKASKALSDSLKALQATVDGVVASLDMLSASAIRATDALVDLNAATGKSNASQTRSTTRVTRAAAAYDAMAVSAARAAEGVASVGTASAGSRLGLPRGGGIGGMLGMLPGPLGVLGRAGSIANTLTGGALGHLAEGAGIVDAVVEAGKLQQILLSIKNETGASNSQIGKFSDAAYTIGAQNGMSVDESGEILRTISRLTAGQFSTDKMLHVAPMVAKYASLVHFNRPDISVEDAARTGIQTAHLFRAYTPQALNPLLDSTYRLSGLMAEKPDAALRQMSYYVPLFKAAHVDDQTSLATMALLDRAGFRNKVGTNVRALALESFGPLQITQSAQAGKQAILQNMGLLDSKGKFAWNTKGGGVDFFGELGSISKWSSAQQKKNVPMSTIISEMTGALGRTGATVGALFLDKQMPGILDGIRKYLKDPSVGLTPAGKNRDSGFDYQFTTAGKDFQSLATEIGGVALPGLTKGFKDLGDSFHDAQLWLHQHKDVEKQWSDEVTATVQGVEQYLTTHKTDLVAIGNDVGRVAQAVGTLGHYAGMAIGPLTDLVRVAGDILTLNFKDLRTLNESHRTAPPKDDPRNGAAYNKVFGANGTLRGPSPPAAHGKSGGPTMAIPAWFHSAPIINVDARGNSATPQAIAAAAAAGVKAALVGAPTGAAHRTGPRMPNPNTVSLGHGAH